MTQAVHLMLFGQLDVRSADGRSHELPRSQKAVLAALAVAPGPVDRSRLADAALVSRDNLSSLLSRLKSTLGVPVHLEHGRRDGMVALDPATVSTDLSQLEAELAAGLLGRKQLRRWLALVTGDRLHGVQLDLQAFDAAAPDRLLVAEHAVLRQAAAFDLAGESPRLLSHRRPVDNAPGEVWLAHLDRIEQEQGLLRARAELAAMGPALGVEVQDRQLSPHDLGAVVVETASAVRRLPPPDQVGVDAGLLADSAPGDKMAAAVIVRCEQAGPALIDETLTLLGRRSTRAHGAWMPTHGSAVVEISELLRAPLGVLIRQQGAPLPPPAFIRAVLSAWQQRAPESDFDFAAFLDTAAAVLAGAEEGPTVLVVGRTELRADDCDRALVGLLRRAQRLRLLVAHRDEPAVHGGPLDELLPVRAELPTATRGEHLFGADDRATALDRLEPDEPDRSRGVAPHAVAEWTEVVALCAVDGAVHRQLAEYSLRAVGATMSLDDLVAVGGGLTSDGHGEVLAATSRSSAQALSEENLRWLGRRIGAWLRGRSVHTIDELRLLLRHSATFVDPSSLGESFAVVRRSVDRRVSLGNYGEAVALLTEALDAAPPDGNISCDLLTHRGDVYRELGEWTRALDDYRRAATVAQAETDYHRLANLGLRMARLTWDPSTGAEVDQLLRQALDGLGAAEPGLRARVTLCLGGGTFQDGQAGTTRVPSEDIKDALTRTDRLLAPEARAWALIHARKALLEVASTKESLILAERIVASIAGDRAVAAHGHQAMFVDLIRRGEWSRADTELTTVEQLAQTPQSAEQEFSATVARVCWSLATGDLESAAVGLAAEKKYKELLGGSVFDQVTLAHEIWLARERADHNELRTLAEAATDFASRNPEGAIWAAGAALLWADVGEAGQAAEVLATYASTHGGFDSLPMGAHRLPILAISANVALLDRGRTLGPADRRAIVGQLEMADPSVVLIGWPTVILGSVDRFLACGYAAVGQRARSQKAFDAAIRLERPMPGLHRWCTAARAIIDQG